jgi:hypothetical protein
MNRLRLSVVGSRSTDDRDVGRAVVEDVSVHGLFGKTGKSDLALVERIGDNILYVA